ncbi:MAG: adenine-specific methyltransferase EcoRI family protein [Bacteroidales bacterium]|nr:adenine-specific methyltransferase EcoRI family protein [Bacteroidales bacterium]
MPNKNLQAAKAAKNDEFYTQYPDIQKEVNAYLEYNPDVFRDKIVLLPCDDPEWSNFTKFFAQNFESFGLRKLISTSYAIESKKYKTDWQPTRFETENPNYDIDKSKIRGKIFTLTHDTNQNGKIDINDLEWKYLQGDGDFRSPEVRALRDEADIIVTNPPFSMFREFLAWIMEAEKQFLIIGNMNAITYKEVFPLIKENKLWLGNGFNGGNAYFRIEGKTSADYANGVYDENTGLVKFRNCCWYTNLDHGRRHQPMQLMTEAENIKFSKHKEVKSIGYHHYDNYDAIDIPFSDSIPSDYEGAMGVPISWLDKYCPEQFEILGLDRYVEDNPHYGHRFTIKQKETYARILICKKQ